MSERDDGGPAFPIPADEPGNTYTGMSLRDYFAGQALAGICANPDISKWCADNEMKTQFVRADYVMSAYEIADMVLAERAK